MTASGLAAGRRLALVLVLFFLGCSVPLRDRDEPGDGVHHGTEPGDPLAPFLASQHELDRPARKAQLEAIARKHRGTRWAGRARLLLGRMERDWGDPEKAISHLSHDDVRKTFLRPYAYVDLAELQIAQGRPDGALASLSASNIAAEAPVLAPRVRLLEARALALQGRPTEAFAVLEKLKETLPADRRAVPVLYESAAICETAGDRERALDFYQTIFLDHPCARGGRCPRCESAMWRRADEMVEASGRSFPPEKLLGRSEALFACEDYRKALSGYMELDGQKEIAQDLVKLRIGVCQFKLGRKKQAIATLSRYRSGSEARRREATYYLARSHLKNGSAANYHKLMDSLYSGGRTRDAWAAMAHLSLGRYYELKNKDKTAAYHYEKGALIDPSLDKADEALWKAGWFRYTARQYGRAIKIFSSMKERFPDSPYRFAAMYWGGRSLEAAGEPDRARQRYVELLDENIHGYYRLLALRRLRSGEADGLYEARVPLVYRPDAETGGLHETRSKVALKRITALMELGLVTEAEDEIAHLLEGCGQTREVHRSLARLYHRKGRFFDGVVSLRRGYPALSRTGLPPGEWRILYPLIYWDTIRAQAETFKTDPFLVAAVIRQESIFNPGAVSSAQAVGVMQILPSTGKWLSRRLALGAFHWRDLLDPRVNIQMGTYYLSMLQEEFKGNVIDSLSAYNAGDGRVSRWRKSIKSGDDEEFVESIPFRETAWYVKNIVLFREAYDKLYGSLY